MAMENPIIREDFTGVNGIVNSYSGKSTHGSVMLDVNVKESENPENGLLEDLDSYWEDINDRLTVSRMVSDSVIKGIVNAVEQEAAENIAQKELELARLKQTLHLYHVGSDENESSGSVVIQHEPRSAKHEPYSSISDASCYYDYNSIGESLGNLNNVAKEQLKNLRKEIDGIRGSCSIRRINSGSEMVGLGGIPPNNVSDMKWMDVDKTLDSLTTTLGTICEQVDNMVSFSKASFGQWQQEKEFQGEIEEMVIMNCIQSLKEEFEQKLWDQNVRFCGNELDRIKEISSLRHELDSISKLLNVPEFGQIMSHGSIEIGEVWDNNKRTDHLHRKSSGNHVSLSTSLREGNGKHDEPVIAMPEKFEFAQLKHMSKEDLVSYFKSEMTEMKRNHEKVVGKMTDEYFGLRRDYLKDKGSSLLIKKDKELDILRKKIPEVILKLDGILVENEKLPTFSKNAESLRSLNNRFESLLSENLQLRTLLSDRKREAKHLSLQVSDTAEIMLQHSLVESNLVKRIENLQCALEDAHIEASISEDLYICLLREVVDSSKSITDQSDTEYKIMQENYKTIYREAAQNAVPSSTYEFEDSEMESIIIQGLCGIIFREAFKEAKEKLSDLNMKYIHENELRISAEMEALQKERALRLEVAEKERLKQEILLLLEEKEKSTKEAEAALVKQKERFELVSQELSNLREETSQTQILISKSSKESEVLKGKLSEALKEIEVYKVEVHELKQKLELTRKELRETNEEKTMLVSVTTQEKQKAISLVEAKEREHRKQMQSLIILVQGLLKAVTDSECRVMEDIRRSNLRLDNLSSHLRTLIQSANVIKRAELMYKQRLEKKCSDLKKAEAEVDLLGDEVETLLSLLEKIYIALDHYSPILQHYPGVIEILKLVKRELSGESTKQV